MEYFNNYRSELFNSYHPEWSDFDAELTFAGKTAAFLGHKVVSVISLPLNAVEIAGCLSLAVLSGAVIGGAKVAIFVLSLGHIKPEVSTGVNSLLLRACNDFAAIVLTGLENCYEVVWLFFKTLEQVVFAFFECLDDEMHTFSDLDLDYEEDVKAREYSPFERSEETLNGWRRHKIHALPMAALHGVQGAVFGALAVVTLPLLAAKIALFALTDWRPETPTYHLYCLDRSLEEFSYLGQYTIEVLVDVPGLFLIAARSVNLTVLIEGAWRVFTYTLEAVFS